MVLRFIIVCLVFLPVFSCDSDPDMMTTEEDLVLPPGFPEPIIPEDSPYTVERVELGRHLFYDKALSGNGEQACASCHLQKFAFSDGLKTPKGSTDEPLIRNSQHLTNIAYNGTLTWANPILKDLETQLLIPIFGEHPVELGVTGNEDLVMARFKESERYQKLYANAFPDEDAYTWPNTVKALATFVRSLISGNSPFDKLTYQNDPSEMSEAALRGMEIFFSEKQECHHCHGGFNFTESTVHSNSAFDSSRFHNTGLYNVDGFGSYPVNNQGVFDVTSVLEDTGRFRAPTLRNIAVTAPFMHDGSMETLEEVIRFYEAGGRNIESGPLAGDGRKNPYKSGFVAGFTLTDNERDDLIQFLHALTDTTFLTNPAHSDPNPEKAR